MSDVNELTGRVIGCAMKVHSALGPGLLESAYEACLEFELNRSGLKVERQLALPVLYEGARVDCGYRVDLLVENEVVLELKAVDAIAPIHEAQLLSYLKLSGNSVGLLINFNTVHLRDGIKRMVNDYKQLSPRTSATSAVKKP